MEISGYFFFPMILGMDSCCLGQSDQEDSEPQIGRKTKCDGLENKAGSSLISELGGQKGSLKSQREQRKPSRNRGLK